MWSCAMDLNSRGQNRAAGSCENTLPTVWVPQNVGKSSTSTSVVELAPHSFSRSRDQHSIFYCLLGTPRNECRGRNSADGIVASLRARPGLTNLWNASPKWQAAFIAVSIFFYLFCPTSVSVLWRICVHIYTLLTVYRLCMNYRCYQMILAVKHFYRNRQPYAVSTGYLSLGYRPGDDWTNTWHWTKRFTIFLLKRR